MKFLRTPPTARGTSSWPVGPDTFGLSVMETAKLSLRLVRRRPSGYASLVTTERAGLLQAPIGVSVGFRRDRGQVCRLTMRVAHSEEITRLWIDGDGSGRAIPT